MKLEKMQYKDLSHKAKETWNFQKVSAKLVEYGFATNWLNVDFESADFVAVHFNGIDIIKVQLKGRVTIDKKYMGKDIYICFPMDDSFCLIEHEKLIEYVGEVTNWLDSSSWVDHFRYNVTIFKDDKKIGEFKKEEKYNKFLSTLFYLVPGSDKPLVTKNELTKVERNALRSIVKEIVEKVGKKQIVTTQRLK